jgi:AcrR family transcriptional regulator
MAIKRERRERDPEATRAAILAASRELLARDGPEGLSVVQVAHLAGVNRGTAYQYFPDRERLLHATIASVSEGLIDAVWSPNDASPSGLRFTDKSLAGSAGRLAAFTAQNANFCRVWLFDLLSSDDPGSDPFSRAWFENVRAFCKSDLAVPGIDADAYAAFTLTAYLIWPIWTHSDKLKPHAQQQAAQRLVEEVLRMAMYGVMKVDRFPTVRQMLAHEKPPIPESGTTETGTGPKKRSSKQAKKRPKKR